MFLKMAYSWQFLLSYFDFFSRYINRTIMPGNPHLLDNLKPCGSRLKNELNKTQKNWVQDRSIKCSQSNKSILKMFKPLNCLNSSNNLNPLNSLNSLNSFIWFQNCLNLFRFNMIWIVTILKHFWTCWNMSKLVQIQNYTNCYDS